MRHDFLFKNFSSRIMDFFLNDDSNYLKQNFGMKILLDMSYNKSLQQNGMNFINILIVF
jgi:hypothetical protein